MNRRRFLGGVALAAPSLALAGCLEALGFEEESAWRDPPMVPDRPEAVYHPASTEEMGRYGGATDGEYALSLSYTVPHRFFTVTGETTNRVQVLAEDNVHLMATVWDPESGVLLPVALEGELRRGGEVVAPFSPWPMLSQRMGFHHGNNVSLPEEGEYTAVCRVGPLDARATGDLSGRFESAGTLAVDFTYRREDVHDLSFDRVDREKWGSRAALPLMAHGDEEESGGSHDNDHGDGEELSGDPGHPPMLSGPPVEDLEGTVLGPASSADATIGAIRTDARRFADGTPYLALFVRTPYNDVVVPRTSLSVAVEREGRSVLETTAADATVDHAFGHHYGVPVEDLAAGDAITVTVDATPQVARHDGYETAFFDFEPVTFTA